MAKICVVGSSSVDLYVETNRLPVIGETLQATGGGQTFPGGKGANQAATASLLGVHTFFVGQVGSDSGGSMLQSELTQRGVDITYTKILSDVPTGQAIIFLLESRDNAIVIIGGANMAWTDLPEEVLPSIQQSNALLLQREVPDSVNLSAATVAKQNGKLVIMDMGGKDQELPDELLRQIDILSPNTTELSRMTGIDDVEQATDLLIAKGLKHIVVKLGSQGSLYKGELGTYRQSAFNKPDLEIKDTTGAGDCYTAALAVKLVESPELTLDVFKEAMHFASVAAFIAITRIGAMPSLPTLSEVQAIINE